MKKTLLTISSLLIAIVMIVSGCSTASNDNIYDSESNQETLLPDNLEGDVDDTLDDLITPDDDNGDVLPPTNDDENDNNDTEEDDTYDDDSNNGDDSGDDTNTAPQLSYDIIVISKTNNLNIRSGKGSSYSSLGMINTYDGVPYLGTENGWYKTLYLGQTAYISADTNYTYLKSFVKDTDSREAVIEIGKELLGFPYVYGAERLHYGNGNMNYNFNSTEFDCSSLTQYAYYISNKIILDTTTRSQVYQGTLTTNLRRGDLMFFTNASREHYTDINMIGHVAIYLGDNYILHTASDYAVIEPISTARWGYYKVTKSFLP